MPERLAAKRLTASDLTLFEWQFRNNPAGNQKAINLNADVFIDKLYPLLPEYALERGGKIPVDLSILGPGNKPTDNLQRKIVKTGTYKNWRLDGEFIYGPPDDPNRYSEFAPGDIAVMAFSGELTAPDSLTMILLTPSRDAALHGAVDGWMGAQSMRALSQGDLASLLADAGTPTDHPLYSVAVDGVLEDVALGGALPSAAARRVVRRVTKEDVRVARLRADAVGWQGEEFVDGHLAQMKAGGLVIDHEWISLASALEPLDFRVTTATGDRSVDVKSTSGDFARPLHISMNELLEMRDGGRPYDLYRVFQLTETGAKLRVAENLGGWARDVLASLAAVTLVKIDSVAVDPASLPFQAELDVRLPDNGTE